MSNKNSNISISADNSEVNDEPLFNLKEYCRIAHPKDIVPYRKRSHTSDYHAEKVIQRFGASKYRPSVIYAQS